MLKLIWKGESGIVEIAYWNRWDVHKNWPVTLVGSLELGIV